MVISRTPFRISFFGGGTDFPDWYKNHGGEVLTTSINKYCYLSVRYLPPFWGDKYRIIYSKVEERKFLKDIEHPAIPGIIKYLKIKEGLEIHHAGDLPARSGIASSSAFTVGLLNALLALKGQMIHKSDLADKSIYVEQKVLKETVGCQDQVIVAHGGFKHIAFNKSGDILVKPMTLPKSRIELLSNHLMLFYTGISRLSSDISKNLVSNITDQEKSLHKMQEMVSEAIIILNSNKDIKDFGKLLHESWLLKKSLSSSVSNQFIDELYLTAQKKGAIGGKIIGAGGGGFLLLFVPPNKQNQIKRKFKKLINVPFKFEDSGSQIIFSDKQEEYTR